MRTWIAVTAGFVLSCSVSDRATSIQSDAPYACERDRDCNNVGRCLTQFGICARDGGDVMTVLFEVTPRASEPIYGGARYLVEKNLATATRAGDDSDAAQDLLARGIKPGWLELNLPPRVPVSGSIKVDPQAACISRPLALSTLPATLVFTPRARLLGLSVQSYEMSTTYDDEIEEFVFHGSLPPGDYDVYMRPVTERLAPECKAIPQIFRDRSIGSCAEPNGCEQELLELQPPPSRPLRLTIPWQPELEGWVVDMVHPVTGELISNKVRLTAADVVDGKIVASLNYSPLDRGSDFIQEAAEVVRLAPPKGVVAGTVLFLRSGLELFDRGEGVVGNVPTGIPVDYQTWVWKKDEHDSPVPGVVSFAALDLDEVAEGVLVSFSESAEVDERGQVNVSLLPGRYRVRVTPPALDDPALGLLAGVESSITVWPATGGGAQAGHVLQVPPAVNLRGTIVAEHGDAPLRDVEVRASASKPAAEPCAGAADTEGATGPVPCEGLRVLREARAQDPYIPRTRSSLSDGNGSFLIDGLDCGPCQPGAGATFDLSVRPGLQTGLAWWVRPGIRLDSDVLMEPLEMPTPVAVPVQLTYANPIADDEAPSKARGLPGALVRVFALLDNDSQVIADTEGLVPCVTNPDASRCIQSLLQIAELRSGPDGEFLLLLPPRVE